MEYCKTFSVIGYPNEDFLTALDLLVTQNMFINISVALLTLIVSFCPALSEATGPHRLQISSSFTSTENYQSYTPVALDVQLI